MTEQEINTIGIIAIAGSNLFTMLQNASNFKASLVEQRKINLVIRALIESLRKIES